MPDSCLWRKENRDRSDWRFFVFLCVGDAAARFNFMSYASTGRLGRRVDESKGKLVNAPCLRVDARL